MTNNIEQFREAMQAAGLNPPSIIDPSKIHKFPGEGKGPGNTAAWCKLFDDGDGGVFGDFTTGLSSSWQAHQAIPYTQAEREDFMRKVAEERAQRDAEEKAGHEAAAKVAREMWGAANPAPADHPYLLRKGIKPHGVRLHDGKLLIPLRDADGKIWSLQFIAADGGKKFLTGGRVKGCYFSIGSMAGAIAMCFDEGFATAGTINEATGHPVAVAFNAGNMGAVAKIMRAKNPDIPLIACGDDDHKTAGNPGIAKATEAARAVGGLLALPAFGPDRGEGDTDFNDMARLYGLDSVRKAIAGQMGRKEVSNVSNVSGRCTENPITTRAAEEVKRCTSETVNEILSCKSLVANGINGEDSALGEDSPPTLIFCDVSDVSDVQANTSKDSADTSGGFCDVSAVSEPIIPDDDHRPCFKCFDDWQILPTDAKLKSGVWFFGIKAGKGDTPPAPFQQFVCSPVKIEAVTFDGQENNFGRLLRIKNTLGRWREWAMPMEMLRGAGDDLRGELLAMGVEIDPAARNLLSQYLQSAPPSGK